jgi:hypothetical protein
MAPRLLAHVLAVAVAMVIAAGGFGAVEGHDAPHGSRLSTKTRIDPRSTYPARLVAAGGGHFHAILVGPMVYESLPPESRSLGTNRRS